MLSYHRLITNLCALGCAAALAACAGQPLSDSDRIATRVAEDLAVAATLTAVAQAQAPQSATEAPVALAPTETPVPATPEPPAPTEPPAELATPTEIPVPPTAPPEPTEPPLAYTDVNFSGNPVPGEDVGGTVQIAGAELSGDQLPLVHSFLAIRVDAHIPGSAAKNGAGIEQVRIQITEDETNEVVQDQIEKNASYCSFGGGEPDCTIWVFAEHDHRWPIGQPIADGTYTVNITMTPIDSDNQTVFWNFQFEVAQS